MTKQIHAVHTLKETIMDSIEHIEFISDVVDDEFLKEELVDDIIRAMGEYFHIKTFKLDAGSVHIISDNTVYGTRVYIGDTKIERCNVIKWEVSADDPAKYGDLCLRFW